ncbi:MAG: TauD/TfdA family dioxygenase [Gammaproteobacteria bacterium]|nr:TauD/TfdA family dioxygenase [Gammaproteobacteria bacterium]
MQPLSISCSSDFDIWARHKLSLYSTEAKHRLLEPLEINLEQGFSNAQLRTLRQRVEDYNLVIYQLTDNHRFEPEHINTLAGQLGLITLDAHLCVTEDLVSLITDTSQDVTGNDQRKRYIPYSNKPLNWHTDGYYNPYHQRVRAIWLHCQQAASRGGENSFIDPEIVYILLRQENPEFIEALSHPEVMRIPANIVNEKSLREETASSVFQVSEDFSRLEMRYSQRKRHIIWRDDALTREALAFLNDLLEQASIWRVDYRLQAGQGVISNNTLHRRNAYEDDAGNQRVYIRARYYNPIRPN